MEAGKRSISDIFNGNRILEIPFFLTSLCLGRRTMGETSAGYGVGH